MRFWLIIFFIGLIINAGFSQDYSEKTSDSVDVRALVQSQVDIAREKEKEDQLKNEKINDKIAVKENKEVSNNLSSFEPFSNTIFIKSGVIILFAGFIFSFVLLRRKRSNSKKDFNKIFKENINLIRSEKLMSREEDPALNDLRNRLVKWEAPTSRSISSKAKALQISKGELILAAKIKSYQLAQISFKNK